jgi:hypothetical protein
VYNLAHHYDKSLEAGCSWDISRDSISRLFALGVQFNISFTQQWAPKSLLSFDCFEFGDNQLVPTPPSRCGYGNNVALECLEGSVKHSSYDRVPSAQQSVDRATATLRDASPVSHLSNDLPPACPRIYFHSYSSHLNRSRIFGQSDHKTHPTDWVEWAASLRQPYGRGTIKVP